MRSIDTTEGAGSAFLTLELVAVVPRLMLAPRSWRRAAYMPEGDISKGSMQPYRQPKF